MHNPISTYRIQFNKDFTLKDLDNILEYLHQLGISTIYASPIFEATPGSNHGYDVTNPHRVNPEIGTLDELRAISKKIKAFGMRWMQDIVPNHMAFHPNNLWLMDVMEKGEQSFYAPFFDIIWQAQDCEGKLMVPFLGGTLPDLINNKEIQIIWGDDGFKLQYTEQNYPINANSYLAILKTGEVNRPEDLANLINKANHSVENLKETLIGLSQKAEVSKYIDGVLAQINAEPTLLSNIIDSQYYKPCLWSETDKKINYRRFFTVNGLICLNIQDASVFEHYHTFIKSLLDEGIFQGLRIDHIDGLFDPTTYLERLRALVGNDVYIVVEKILEAGEQFPVNWPVQGNTGYDFLALVNNLLTKDDSKHILTKFYKKVVSDDQPVHNAILEKKSNILYKHMAGELENLYQLFIDLNLDQRSDYDSLQPGALKTAIAEFLIQCPVYRYYGNSFPLLTGESKSIEDILKDIVNGKPELTDAIKILENTFLAKHDSQYNARALRFYQRCMQFTGPIMAKGVEDTLMYTYDRFIGHNEVGDTPETFGMKVAEFHRMMLERQQLWPLSINGTSTHDTKRGEDVRARLNVLTDVADSWLKTVEGWQKLNAPLHKNNAPDANDEYLIYQTITGAHPLPQQDQDKFPERMQEYLTKALREAKTKTTWAEPDEDYENETLTFTENLFDKKNPFYKSFHNYQSTIVDFAVINSLTQVLLKFTCPGIPDVYQGCELYDFSLVDPDNRRRVDYQTRSTFLENIEAENVSDLWQDRYTGKIKLWLTHKLLLERKNNPDIFSEGMYLQLQTTGKYQDNIIAYARQQGNEWRIFVASLNLASICTEPADILNFNWEDTAIVLPRNLETNWVNIITNESLKLSGKAQVKTLFAQFPLVVLKSNSKPDKKRSAGILLHITSLPSKLGIGDIGPEAHSFVDFLTEAGQKYWQMLPVNPTEATASYSPYSSFSSMAGYTLLISPEELVKDGLLQVTDIKNHEYQNGGTVDFEKAFKIKGDLFDLAFTSFNQLDDTSKFPFEEFKQREHYWLDNFSLYEVIKNDNGGKPWHQWPDELKLRNEEALNRVKEQKQSALEKSKWLQFIFSKQWAALKKYGNSAGIEFYGDLPFYISYDSVDVWTNPQFFELNNAKEITGIAGVPPDYFNAEGQLWGMPVYNWENIKKDNYQWWIKRIQKNLEFFDVIRLDHFRAFSAFWQVPAGETNAINGRWVTGPGAGLFKALEKQIGKLPFVAEDLGDITPEVYQLRDNFKLPGMQVLQFSFGEDQPETVHSLHNHLKNSVAYTGTHDNNTTRGWFEENAAKADRKRLKKYVGYDVKKKNVHKALIRLCYMSAADVAILPMQDILGLDGMSRMNVPSSKNGNWTWCLQGKELTTKVSRMLKKLAKTYNR
jgi:malto-oligosyltrehalose synthase/4-alpha-glucanotransferase